MKYTDEFKLSVVEHYLAGAVGFKTLAQQYGVADSMLRAWVSRYRLHGVEGLSKRYGRYSADFKRSVLQHMWDNGLSYRQTAAIFNIPRDSSIGDWERRYKSGGIDNLVARGKASENMKAPAKKLTAPLPGADKRTQKELWTGWRIWKRRTPT